MFCFPNFSFQPGVRSPGEQERRTAPRMVLTSSCQFLMTFKYVMEFEGLVYASSRRTWPRERVRVSKRLIVPLRAPVNTRNWFTWRSERDGIYSRLWMCLPLPGAAQRHHFLFLSSGRLSNSLRLA
jgi:hypothetical protein